MNLIWLRPQAGLGFIRVPSVAESWFRRKAGFGFICGFFLPPILAFLLFNLNTNLRQ